MSKVQYPFYIIILAIFIGIISPFLLTHSMFMDGILYADIAHNLARGLGSFWDVKLTETLYPHFHEHPPLAFGLQSLWFRLFGDSIYIEKLYSLTTFFITAILIHEIWQMIQAESKKYYSWIALFFWILIPLVTWAAPNNMLENTMMIFTTWAVLHIFLSSKNRRLFHLSMGGILLFLGVLSKGLVALFPLALPFWLFIYERNALSFKRFIADSLVLLVGISISFLILFVLMPESKISLYAYFTKQIMGSIQSVQTVESRFFILVRLLKELLPMIIVSLIVVLIPKKEKISYQNTKWSVVLFLLGLSGVVPIMISMKQSGFYILATFPLFSLSLASFILPNVEVWVQKVNARSSGFRIFKYLSIGLVVVSIGLSLSQVGRMGRDKEKLEDVLVLTRILPKGTTISISNKMEQDWSLHGYMYRYGDISLEVNSPSPFLLTLKGANVSLIEYNELSVQLHTFSIYKKKTIPQ